LTYTGFWIYHPTTEYNMDYKEPRTRTETKKQGKKDGKPFSAKHVRLQEALAAAAATKKAAKSRG
jgi:hypothetical protein